MELAHKLTHSRSEARCLCFHLYQLFSEIKKNSALGLTSSFVRKFHHLTNELKC